MECPMDCHKKNTNKCCGIGYAEVPAALGDDTGEYKPVNGAYFNTLVKYAANNALYLYVNNGAYVKIKEGDN